MERNIVLPILAMAILAVGAAILLPGGRQVDPDPKVPWRVTVNPDGSSEVFGLTLGRSTLQDAQRLLDDEADITLFAAPDGALSLEAYFEQVLLSGLRADMVMTLDMPVDRLQTMYDQGLRVSKLGSGARKVSLSSEDSAQAQQAPIRFLTYLPMADLDPEIVEKRFGAPAERIPVDGGVSHWLYPELGLDIAMAPERKEVFQYVMPREFDELIARRLRAEGGREASRP
jgi:hypothetical protein